MARELQSSAHARPTAHGPRFGFVSHCSSSPLTIHFVLLLNDSLHHSRNAHYFSYHFPFSLMSFLTHSPCNTSFSLLLRDMSGSIICTTSQNQPRAQEKCCSRQTPAKATQNPHAIYWQQLRGQAFALESDFTSITEDSSTGQFS